MIEILLRASFPLAVLAIVLALCVRERRRQREHQARMRWADRQLRPGATHSCSRCDPSYPFRAGHFDMPCPYEKGPR